MQVGGNANATQFFKQHGCNSNDAQIKYKSRAAQLYKRFKTNMATQSSLIQQLKQYIYRSRFQEDFFTQVLVHASQSATSLGSDAYIAREDETLEQCGDIHGEQVDHLDSEAVATSAPHVTRILKKPVKKSGAAKKSTLGAQKVNIDFENLEQRANILPKVGLSARLAMQDIQKKTLEAKVSSDPQKAGAVDRLGMGGFGRPCAAHSVAQGVKPIRQRAMTSISPTRKGEEDWEVKSFFFLLSLHIPLHNAKPLFRTTTRTAVVSAPVSEFDIQKKFAGAKSISSDMYFGNNEMDYETKAALSRFEGQSSLGSADLWGQGSQPQYSQVPEMSDIKDSLRAGASKVAEKFSSLSMSLSSYMSVGNPPIRFALIFVLYIVY
ncbi:unnamed protein product [Angiostrongylus costaricensis]|uniref:ADP-ribosylation factor GTPase-activating protein AGD8 n=1 Tax=Angiostrongylus costaricensis TaxID=334426 RepID=A0A0R3PTE1_ANGCS|nr:unnamed protein product [Angiostrongylus costaricensis]